AQQCLEALSKLLHSTSTQTIKAVIPIFSTIYPLLFKLLATSRPPQAIVDLFQSSKSRIISFALDASAQPNVGVRAVAWKFLQRVLLSSTRAAGTDPRLQHKAANPNDVNVSMITPGSALQSSEAEEEGNQLLTQLVTHLYSASEPAILHPLINSLPLLCKSRPSLAAPLVSSMTLWTPSALGAAGRQPMEIRTVEKTMRVVMSHILRHPPFAAFAAQLNDALVRQRSRMEAAFVAEQTARRERRRAAKAAQSAKHPMDNSPSGVDPESSEQAHKRAKLESEGAVLQVQPGPGAGKGVEVDISGIEVDKVIEAVMAGLEVVPMELLDQAFENARRNLAEGTPDAIPVLAAALGISTGVAAVKAEAVKEEDYDEVLNPLDMDLDDDDLLLEDFDDAVEDEDEALAGQTFTSFTLPPPEPLDAEEKEYVLSTAIERIWTTGTDLSSLPDNTSSAPNAVGTDAFQTAVKPKEMWMLLLARLATRGAETKRKIIADFVVADFVNRSKFASVWLNEEWYNSRLGALPSDSYSANLLTILNAYLPKIDAKDRSLSSFLADLPEIPSSVTSLLEDLCQDTDRNLVGFLALRDIVESRPPARKQALDTLLGLCTHPERKIRVPGIITTIRRWGPDSPMMPTLIRYALGVLWRLASVRKEGEDQATGEQGEEEGSSNEIENGGGEVTGQGVASDRKAAQDGDVNMEEELSKEDKEKLVKRNDVDLEVSSKFLGEVTPETVQQHVELAFALTKRNQSLLDDIFKLYPLLSTEIQASVEAQLMPLIQSIGPTEKLLENLRSFPDGADKLVMKIITTLSGGSGASPALVAVIKALLSEKELDPKFVVPIIGDLEKSEIERQLPRIISLLANPEDKDLVKTAFASMLGKITPADLLVSLHQDCPPTKLTIDAIGICFSMTTVFRSDVLANAISRVADLPVLPVVLVRTIMQVVTTYKSLIPFIANHVLPKLVTKKIWETPPLWEGFVRLSKLIAPASYGALLQLPKDQLRDLVKRQPTMKGGLKSFLANKPGSKAVLAEIFGDDTPAQQQQQTAAATATTTAAA
ncbi:symplekin, partial [Kwoniella heveanensis CBS 569]